MSIYICYDCENYFDRDYQGCYEHPFLNTECICEGCSMEHEESEESKILSRDQIDIVALLKERYGIDVYYGGVMSMYKCYECETAIDGNFYRYFEHPFLDEIGICESCLEGFLQGEIIFNEWGYFNHYKPLNNLE